MSNLALNKTATASSYIAPFTAAKAVDGISTKPLNRWICDAMPCWMAVDFGDKYWIDRWVVKHMGTVGWASPQYNMTDYKLQGSINNSTWVDLDTVASNTANTTSRSFTPTEVRYVRVYVNSGLYINKGVASIVELEVYESSYDPYLANLTISSGTLNPAFSKKTYAYTDQVGSDVPFVTVTPTAEASNSIIRVKNDIVTSGTPSNPITLQPGDNNITLTVTNGPVTQQYTINVNQQSPAVYLSGFIIKNSRGSAIAYTPDFTPTTFNYSANASGQSSVTITPTAEQAGSTIIYVNDAIVGSGQSSQPISLNTGSNNITIKAVPVGGGSPTTYTIIVNR